VTITALAISPDGTYFISGNRFGLIEVWDAKNFTRLHEKESTTKSDPKVNNLAFSPDGKYFISLESYAIKIWDTQQFNHRVIPTKKISTPMSILHITPNGKYLVVGSTNGQINILDIHNNFDISTTINAYDEKNNPYGHNGRIITLDTIRTPDGEYLVSGDNKGRMQAWDMQDFSYAGTILEEREKYPDPTEYVDTLSIIFNGKYFVQSRTYSTYTSWVESKIEIFKTHIVTHGSVSDDILAEEQSLLARQKELKKSIQQHDTAMAIKKGGIDLDANKFDLAIMSQGKSTADLIQANGVINNPPILNMNIEGLVPVILSVTPAQWPSFFQVMQPI